MLKYSFIHAAVYNHNFMEYLISVTYYLYAEIVFSLWFQLSFITNHTLHPPTQDMARMQPIEQPSRSRSAAAILASLLVIGEPVTQSLVIKWVLGNWSPNP